MAGRLNPGQKDVIRERIVSCGQGQRDVLNDYLCDRLVF